MKEQMNNTHERYIEIRNVVDLDTGEVLPNYIGITEREKVQVVSKETIEKRKEYFYRKNRTDLFNEIADGFTFSNINKVSELHFDKRFTEDEKTRIMFLGTYVSYLSKGSYLTFSNGKPINKQHVRKLLEIKEERKFYSFYNKLLDFDIVEETVINGEIGLKWSEEYHFKGKLPKGAGAKAGVLKTYDKQIQELYQAKKDNGKSMYSPKQLYTVFMMLPFVHYETNIICLNPNEPFVDCNPLELSEIAKHLGFNRSNDLKRKLLKINLKEQPVFKLDTTNKGTYITVNPFVVWRQNKMPEASLMVTFFDTAKRIAEGKGIKITVNDLLLLEGDTHEK